MFRTQTNSVPPLHKAVNCFTWVGEAPKPPDGFVRVGIGDELLNLRDVHNVDRDHLDLRRRLEKWRVAAVVAVVVGSGGGGSHFYAKQSVSDCVAHAVATCVPNTWWQWWWW